MSQEKVLNPREAARRLGVGMPRIYALLWSGKLPAKKQGNRWVISVGAVESRLKAQG
jgi:excisionase family DNA binding protein